MAEQKRGGQRQDTRRGRIDYSNKSTSGRSRTKKGSADGRITQSVVRMMLVLGLVLLVVTLWNNRINLSCANMTQCARDNMAMCGSGSGFPSTIYGSHANSIDCIADNGVALLSDTALTFYDSSAQVAGVRTHFMSKPAMKVAGRYAMLVDLGSTDYRIETVAQTITAADAERTLISCAISRNCRYALVMQGSSHGESWLSSVEVFDREGKSLHKWHCADWYISDAALSADGQYLAMSGINARNGELTSALIIQKVGSSEQIAEYTRDGNYYLTLEYNNDGTLFAIGSTTMTVVTENGSKCENIVYKGDLTAFDVCCESGASLCLRDEVGSRVLVYDVRGRERCAVAADFAVSNVSLSDEACTAMGDGSMMAVRLDGTLIGQTEANATIGGLLLINRRAYMVDGMRISAYDWE